MNWYTINKFALLKRTALGAAVALLAGHATTLNVSAQQDVPIVSANEATSQDVRNFPGLQLPVPIVTKQTTTARPHSQMPVPMNGSSSATYQQSPYGSYSQQAQLKPLSARGSSQTSQAQQNSTAQMSIELPPIEEVPPIEQAGLNRALLATFGRAAKLPKAVPAKLPAPLPVQSLSTLPSTLPARMATKLDSRGISQATSQIASKAEAQIPVIEEESKRKSIAPILMSPVLSRFTKKPVDKTLVAQKETQQQAPATKQPVQNPIQLDSRSQVRLASQVEVDLGTQYDVENNLSGVAKAYPPLAPKPRAQAQQYAQPVSQIQSQPSAPLFGNAMPSMDHGISGNTPIIEEWPGTQSTPIMNSPVVSQPVMGGSAFTPDEHSIHNYSNNYTGDDAYGSEYLDYGYGSHNTSRHSLLVEGLYFDRVGGFFSRSDRFILDPYEYELGGRITYGTRKDDLNGSEISFVGPFEWEEAQTRQDAGGGLNSLFSTTPEGGVAPGNLSAFNNARYHFQAIDSSLNNLEYNKVWHGWDVMKFVLGMRYTRVQDKYSFISRNNVGEVGTLFQETTNNLIGPQVGGELFYDVGERFSYSLRGKLGLMANLYDGQARLNNNGFLISNSDNDNVDFSGLFEFGATAHYQLGPSFRLRAGYEAWVLTEMATVRDNVDFQITRSIGRNTQNDDDIVFHGASVGLELFW